MAYLTMIFGLATIYSRLDSSELESASTTKPIYLALKVFLWSCGFNEGLEPVAPFTGGNLKLSPSLSSLSSTGGSLKISLLKDIYASPCCPSSFIFARRVAVSILPLSGDLSYSVIL